MVFAKVHKAASSTVQNILLRFGVFRELNILFSARSLHLSDRHSRIEHIIPHPQGDGKPFDILCSHLIFNASEISKYFRDSAVRVAILREPMHQSLSALAYYSVKFPDPALRRGFRKHSADPINGFLQHPEDFYNFTQRPTMSYLNNRMSLDLGFDIHTFEKSKKDKTKISAFIEQVEEHFDIVLISDYFHESMVLLKRYLRWSMKDIIFITRNAAKFSNNSVWNRKPMMSPTVSKTFRDWDLVDYTLYEHFEPIFHDKIKQEHSFQDEVSAYKAILRKVSDYCLSTPIEGILHIPGDEWTDEIAFTEFECKLLLMDEGHFVGYARKIQAKRYNQAKSKGTRTESKQTKL